MSGSNRLLVAVLCFLAAAVCGAILIIDVLLIQFPGQIWRASGTVLINISLWIQYRLISFLRWLDSQLDP